MKFITPSDASLIALIGENPAQETLNRTIDDLSPEARKIAKAVVRNSPKAPRTSAQQTAAAVRQWATSNRKTQK